MTLVMEREGRRERAGAALGVAFAHALIGYALIAGLGVRLPPNIAEPLKLFEIVEPPPPAPQPVQPPARRAEEPEGEAAPPNIRSTATQIVAPPPEVRLPPLPPPIIAAPVAGLGGDPSQGAADRPGPGTGAGGEGEGTGSGGSGTGTGSGGGRPARWIGGRIRESDYPRRLYDAGIGGTVHLRFLVGTDGRVRDCRIVRSSGTPELDRITCRLLEQRLRYRPARDARNRPVPEIVDGEHIWDVAPEPPPIEYEADIPD